mmetsp:Transcript_22241/g.38321  ORF Transcript_22241/g.38321 Transcript_22241/m.38321 type:complete len:307 (+) Transcript_22241:147-1067(+)
MANFITSQRPGWEDVVPIPQDDGPSPVVMIDYPPAYIEAMDLFRAVLKTDELSSRSLALSREVIELNPANYTAWHFRRRCLYALGEDLDRELDYIEQTAGPNPKNYQIWYHRRAIVEKIGNASREDSWVRSVLNEDSKNYHAWSHRQWYIKTFDMFDGELEFITECLEDDPRNNSAWNQRWFAIHRGVPGISGGQPGNEAAATVELEARYALQYLAKDLRNPSPWHYLRGYFRNHAFADFSFVKEKCLEWMNDGSTSSYLLGFLVEIYRQENTPESLDEARKLCGLLETEHDVTRSKYWARVQKML